VLIHLPDGPTAHFRLSSVKSTGAMRKKWKEFGPQRPEIILNNFSTRLGHRVARLLASLFHYDPEFKGRRVVTFHNQRDYIFFRQHRYDDHSFFLFVIPLPKFLRFFLFACSFCCL
jgi:ribosome production factor 1